MSAESYICNDVDKTVEYDISMAEKTGAITIVIPNEGPGDTWKEDRWLISPWPREILKTAHKLALRAHCNKPCEYNPHPLLAIGEHSFIKLCTEYCKLKGIGICQKLKNKISIQKK